MAQDANNTMPPGYGLREFVEFLVQTANETASPPTTGQQLTGEERARLVKHAAWLSASVEELATILTEHQPQQVQDYRLNKLWQVLGSACVITSYRIENAATMREMRERAERATEAKKARSQKVNDIIVEVAIAKVAPGWRNNPSRSPWWAAGEILQTLNDRLIAEGLCKENKPLGRDAVRRRLEELKPRVLKI